ncbi:MAG TPA: hypothetical protein VFU97_24560 [Xanthobacteraceae bacterium]|nr:hypothetical protein [Xanthobacteraceae bacterium]
MIKVPIWRCTKCGAHGFDLQPPTVDHSADPLQYQCTGHWVHVQSNAVGAVIEKDAGPKPPDPRKLRDWQAIENALQENKAIRKALQDLAHKLARGSTGDRAMAVHTLTAERDADAVVRTLEWVLHERGTIGR